jgi:tetratricopeptide (TPR) repeat protein
LLAALLALPFRAGAEPDVPPEAPTDAQGAAQAEAPAEARIAAADERLEQALAAAKAANWTESARLSWEAWSAYPASEERREAAEVALAEALEQLGLHQAAVSHFFAVVERRQMPQVLPRALEGVERLATAGRIAERDLLRGVLVDADLATIPPELADFLHYHRGLANLRLGSERWTAYEFDAITDGGRWDRKARIARAVAHVRDNQPAEALAVAEKLIEAGAADEVEQEALLLRARLLFEAGRAEEAIEAFRQVRRTGYVPAGEVLLERAWSHYRAGTFHDSMGLLYALGAPAHEDLFLPEVWVLRGLVYQHFCHFRAARRAATDFRARYADALARIDAGEAVATIPAVSRAVGTLPHVAATLRVADGVVRERERLSDLRSKIARGGLADHLDRMYAVIGARFEHERARAVERGSEDVAERLLVAREQANLLEYEVGVSIHKRVHDAEGRTFRMPVAQKVPARGGSTYYRFDGEYWSDELPDMRFLIENRCVE